MCTYTGPLSGTTPGRCTQTAGYIPNAEINEIIYLDTTNSTRQLYDGSTGTDYLIYNGMDL
jgi:hypothetical protein